MKTSQVTADEVRLVLAREQHLRTRCELYGYRLHIIYSTARAPRYFLYHPSGLLAKESFCLSAVEAFLDEQLCEAVVGLSPAFKSAVAEVFGHV